MPTVLSKTRFTRITGTTSFVFQTKLIIVAFNNINMSAYFVIQEGYHQVIILSKNVSNLLKLLPHYITTI